MDQQQRPNTPTHLFLRCRLTRTKAFRQSYKNFRLFLTNSKSPNASPTNILAKQKKTHENFTQT